mmetsp:Transcript_19441/g.40512  ORF Transcript_19441/g.40512 Transcript_19441/m.40512 type:complete len:255 (-) Transcript_19441:86-850(-)
MDHSWREDDRLAGSRFKLKHRIPLFALVHKAVEVAFWMRLLRYRRQAPPLHSRQRGRNCWNAVLVHVCQGACLGRLQPELWVPLHLWEVGLVHEVRRFRGIDDGFLHRHCCLLLPPLALWLLLPCLHNVRVEGSILRSSSGQLPAFDWELLPRPVVAEHFAILLSTAVLSAEAHISERPLHVLAAPFAHGQVTTSIGHDERHAGPGQSFKLEQAQIGDAPDWRRLATLGVEAKVFRQGRLRPRWQTRFCRGRRA